MLTVLLNVITIVVLGCLALLAMCEAMREHEMRKFLKACKRNYQKKQ